MHFVRRGLHALGIAVCLAAAFALAHASVFGSTSPGSSDVHGVLALNRTYTSLPVLRLSLPDTSPTVDPAMVADEQNVELADLLYSGLVRLDPSYHVVPDAAARWTVSRDRRTYTFQLRPGLRFSNGDPLTAQDFAFSITRSLSPALDSPSALTYLQDIQGAIPFRSGAAKTVRGLKVVNRYTLVITVRWPVPYFLLELTYPTSYALDKKLIKKDGNFGWYANPVGSGPYRLKSWTPNTDMILVLNKNYTGPIPPLRQIRVSFSSLSAENVYRYVNRSLDVASLCPADRAVRGQPGVHETEMLGVSGLYMNMKRKPFNNSAVRRALTEALDRTSIVSHAMGSSVTPFGGFVPPGVSGYDPGLKSLPYDVRLARKTLAAGDGRKRLPSITLYYADDPCTPRIARLARTIAQTWRKNLHLKIDTQAVTDNTLLARAQSDSLPLYLSGWTADYPDPHDWLSLQWQSGALDNTVHYHNDRFDLLTEQADVTWDPARRSALFNRAQQVLADDAAWIPLYVPHRVDYMSPSVRNLAVTGFGLIPRGGSWAEVQVKSSSMTSDRRGL